MRTIIELPKELVTSLDEIGAKEKRSRASLIREAIGEYLVKKQPAEMSAAFGLWAGRQIDSLEYEDQIRAEWEKS